MKAAVRLKANRAIIARIEARGSVPAFFVWVFIAYVAIGNRHQLLWSFDDTRGNYTLIVLFLAERLSLPGKFAQTVPTGTPRPSLRAGRGFHE